jgi:hypothetical protein
LPNCEIGVTVDAGWLVAFAVEVFLLDFLEGFLPSLQMLLQLLQFYKVTFDIKKNEYGVELIIENSQSLLGLQA